MEWHVFETDWKSLYQFLRDGDSEKQLGNSVLRQERQWSTLNLAPLADCTNYRLGSQPHIDVNFPTSIQTHKEIIWGL